MNRRRRTPILRTTWLSTAITACLSISITTPALAGGFALIEHGASGLGHAYAGAAAVSADGSTVWFNPAGMSEISGREFAVGLHFLSTDTTFNNRGTTLGPALGGAEVSGSDRINPGTETVLPNLYYVAPLNDRWHYGLSVGVPFGSSTEYNDRWVGRYTTIKSQISVIDVNPALSYQWSDRVSVGFGISVQRLSATLESAVDSGAVCLNFASNVPTSITAADCVNNNLTPGNQLTDSNADISGDSVSYGFNLGALFQPRPDLKLGISYRHSIDHELDGDGDFTVNPGLRALLDSNSVEATQSITSATLTDGPVTADVKLPAMLSFSGAWQTSDKLELLSDITWTGWDVFEELRVQFDNPVQPDSVSVQDWENAFRFSLGLNYRHSNKLTLRAGYAFDEEPIPSPQRRTARIPGNDRTWVTIGAGYAFSPRLSFDIGYAYLTLDDTPVDNLNAESGGSGSIVRGLYTGSNVNILSAQLNWKFN